MKWINSREQMPPKESAIAAIRLSYPAFFWVGNYQEEDKEHEDTFEWWLALPSIPTSNNPSGAA